MMGAISEDIGKVFSVMFAFYGTDHWRPEESKYILHAVDVGMRALLFEHVATRMRAWVPMEQIKSMVIE